MAKTFGKNAWKLNPTPQIYPHNTDRRQKMPGMSNKKMKAALLILVTRIGRELVTCCC